MLEHYIIFLFLLVGMIGSVAAKKLSLFASLTGGVLALLIYAGFGYIGILFLTTFFIAGVLATSWRRSEKKYLNPDEGSARAVGQVFANAGFAALLGCAALMYPQCRSLFLLLMAAAFSSAISDTLSSEMGNVYGTRFYNVLSFKRDTKGLDGVISLEGTFFGLAGSVIMSLIYGAHIYWGAPVLWVVIAGTIGNLSDSVLGATLERRKLLANNAINFANTGQEQKLWRRGKKVDFWGLKKF